jgi:hypothetical protein
LIFQCLKDTNQLERQVSGFTVAMDLKSIVIGLKMRDMKSRPIYDDLVKTLHDEAFGYSTVTLWLRQERLTRFSQRSHNFAEDRQVRETDQAIL